MKRKDESTYTDLYINEILHLYLFTTHMIFTLFTRNNRYLLFHDINKCDVIQTHIYDGLCSAIITNACWYDCTLRMNFWIYWSGWNSWIYFYIFLNKNWTIYWSDQSFTGLGPEDMLNVRTVIVFTYHIWVLWISGRQPEKEWSKRSIY